MINMVDDGLFPLNNSIISSMQLAMVTTITYDVSQGIIKRTGWTVGNQNPWSGASF